MMLGMVARRPTGIVACLFNVVLKAAKLICLALSLWSGLVWSGLVWSGLVWSAILIYLPSNT